MSRKSLEVIIAILIGITGGFILAACDGNINFLGSPTQVQGGIPSASPSPSPSPFPNPAPTADPCLIKAVRVSFKGGSDAQLPTISVGSLVQIDATPFGDSGQVPDGCNQLRSVAWAVITPTTCQVVGSGFNPFLRGLRVGGCTLTATVERVVSDNFSVEVR